MHFQMPVEISLHKFLYDRQRETRIATRESDRDDVGTLDNGYVQILVNVFDDFFGPWVGYQRLSLSC